MNRKHLLGTLSVGIAVVLVGACGGSAVRSGPPSTNSPAPKLRLAEAGQAPTAAAIDGGAAIYPERPTNYVLDGTLPDLGATARTWRMKAHSVDASAVQRFADALGVAGTPTRTPTGWQLQGSDAILQFDVNGGIVSVSYSVGVPGAVGGSTGSGVTSDSGASDAGGAVVNGPDAKAVPPATPVRPTDPVVAPLPAPSPPVDVPSAADAETIARTLLDRLGVLSDQNWSTATTDSGGVAVACPVGVPCPTVPPEVSARTVTFSLLVDGTRVDGVQWSVTIGEHRRIDYLNGEWATATKVAGDYPLRSTADVFADLRRGTARYATPVPMMAYAGTAGGAAPEIATVPSPSSSPGPGPAPVPSTLPSVAVHVSGVSLGLARWNADDGGEAVVDLVPTYRFHARVDGGEPYDIVLLALDPSAATFIDSVPAPKPLGVEPSPAPSVVPGSAAPPSSP